MPITIKVNSLSLVHRGSGGVSRATLPDVCKTPPSMLPIPYPNTTFSRDLARGTSTVRGDGGHSIAVKDSIFTPSTGDEPGGGGGVASGVHMKESRWLTYSMDVRIEGRNACRLTDKKLHNRGNTVDAAGVMQSNPGSETNCDWENEDGAVIGSGEAPCGCAPGENTSPSPVTPPGCTNVATLKKVLYVNGILNSDEDHCESLKAIAERRCVAVTGVYNKSDGLVKDLVQCVKDKLGLGNNKANDTLAAIMEDHLGSGQPLEIMAHSQGALITSRALNDTLNGAAVEAFGRAASVQPDLSLLTVNTYGGAAWTFPAGTNVTHAVNLIDPVPMLFGATDFAGSVLLGGLLGGGPGMMIAAAAGFLSTAASPSSFLKVGGNPHSFMDIYLKQIAPGSCQCKPNGAT